MQYYYATRTASEQGIQTVLFVEEDELLDSKNGLAACLPWYMNKIKILNDFIKLRLQMARAHDGS